MLQPRQQNIVQVVRVVVGVGEKGVVRLVRVQQLLGKEDPGNRQRVDPDQQGVTVAGVQQAHRQQNQQQQDEQADQEDDAGRGQHCAEVYRLQPVQDQIVGEAAHLHLRFVLHERAAVLDEMIQLLQLFIEQYINYLQ